MCSPSVLDEIQNILEELVSEDKAIGLKQRSIK